MVGLSRALFTRASISRSCASHIRWYKAARQPAQVASSAMKPNGARPVILPTIKRCASPVLATRVPVKRSKPCDLNEIRIFEDGEIHKRLCDLYISKYGVVPAFPNVQWKMCNLIDDIAAFDNYFSLHLDDEIHRSYLLNYKAVDEKIRDQYLLLSNSTVRRNNLPNTHTFDARPTESFATTESADPDSNRLHFSESILHSSPPPSPTPRFRSSFEHSDGTQLNSSLPSRTSSPLLINYNRTGAVEGGRVV